MRQSVSVARHDSLFVVGGEGEYLYMWMDGYILSGSEIPFCVEFVGGGLLFLSSLPLSPLPRPSLSFPTTIVIVACV